MCICTAALQRDLRTSTRAQPDQFHPQLALAAKHLDVPFLASGGIADGRGLAAAIALGACGVNCGTLFIAVQESYVHPRIKDAMVQASERDTTHIFRTLGNTARVFKNKIAMEVVNMERRPGGVEFKEIAPVSPRRHSKSRSQADFFSGRAARFRSSRKDRV